ncbi:MAG TPA: universal stress protein, partial [Verrucomicrobiae bacterium]
SHAALALAAHFAKASGATISLLHVLQLDLVKDGVVWESPSEESSGHARSQLSTLVARVEPGVPVETVIVPGNPAEVIVAEAVKRGAEAIVMCAHGCRGWSRWLHRNTALRVQKRAHCAVWQVSPGRDSQTFNLTLSHQSQARHWTHPFRSAMQVLFPWLTRADWQPQKVVLKFAIRPSARASDGQLQSADLLTALGSIHPRRRL